jgi:hypothetical protein
MRTLIRLAAKLYPHSWRERYGAEFEALLNDTHADSGMALNVLKGAALMQFHRWWKAGTAVLFGAAALFALSARRPYVTPGTNQVFRMDSTPGALFEFMVILILIIVAITTLASARNRWLSPCIAASYLAGVVLVSLLTPQTIVNIGDSYCWDLWCVGVRNVTATAQDKNILYTAEASLFVDSTTAELPLTGQPSQFFSVTDERGRRFPILRYAPLGDAKTSVKPGETAKFSLTFYAPADARNLYLTGDTSGAPPWVRLYFGSDLNPFHKRTLLRVV